MRLKMAVGGYRVCQKCCPPTYTHVALDVCTLQESLAYRKLLRSKGEDEFLSQTVEAGTISAKKLCTAFGIRPPAFLEGQPDYAYYNLLALGICRELSKRVKLPQYNTVDDVINLIKTSNNIIVLTGAGVRHTQTTSDQC